MKTLFFVVAGTIAALVGLYYVMGMWGWRALDRRRLLRIDPES